MIWLNILGLLLGLSPNCTTTCEIEINTLNMIDTGELE